MEKRTILAFALSFLVLILWSFLFNPSKDQVSKKSETPETVAQKTVSQSPETASAPHAAISKAPEETKIKLNPETDEKEVVVDTPLYRAVFTNAGPTIKSFKLKEYRETVAPDSPPIELINLYKKTSDFLVISFDGVSVDRNKKPIYQVEQQKIRLEPGSSPKNLIFRTTTPSGISISQNFHFYPNQYRIDLHVDVINQSGEIVTGAFVADIKALPPKGKKSYYSYVGLVLLLDDKLKQIKTKKISEEKVLSGQIDWMAYEDSFFISAVIPDPPSKGSFKGRLLPSGVLEGTYLPSSISLKPTEQISSSYTLYLGPRDMGILKQLGKNLDKAVNFGWTDIIAKPLLYTLRFFNHYINNFGVSIILLTILIKILFWPLTHKSYKSMKEMQKLQPRMAKIREKYKNNKAQLNKEMMGLYKTYKVNPMGGCLPMIVQLPVFFALYRILGSAIELRQAPFMFWINDLSAPDRLFNFSFSIPFMKPPYGIPVLTLLMGASMFLQQKMTPTPGDPTQAKLMMFLPLIFTFMFINFSSGLVLYWLVNNLLSIGQQYRIYKS
ncbi:MAG: membrane protein insertase YidC [Desulfobacteraceae bacterium 4484_190.2]|nr:MAG: membrane protein insertase YidC [Desulfobacteraceae bacterium 4484_190.2]